jgi:hypothetical protein
MRLIGRWLPGAVALGVIVLLATVVMAAAGQLGIRQHDQGQARASAACTPARVASFVELGLPCTISAPMGERDGACTDTFVVPGTALQVEARIDARLHALGWIRANPDAGPARHYRREGLRLTVRDEGDIGNSGNMMITMVIM